MLRTAQAIAGAYLLLALVVTVGTLLAGPLPGGPAPLAGVREGVVGRNPVAITILYGTEKRDWLEDAAVRFAATDPRVGGRPVEVKLEGVGSRAMVLETVAGEAQPTVLSPASSIHLEVLRSEWQTRYGTAILHDGDDAPQPLVITPLVVVAWEDRARALQLDDPTKLWQNLHAVLADPQGWARFDHPEWGFARLGHTSPESSNSGIQTIVLLAYAYHQKTTGLGNADILDPGFQSWFDDFESAVPEFPSSTGFLMDDMLRFGPSKYHFIVVYENLAIENFEIARGRGGTIRTYYPPANILSDHPYAILAADWVSEDQRAAAALFRDFLLSEELQRLALVSHGFRPALNEVPLNAPGNPFDRYADYGIQMDIAQSVEVPSGAVINELIDLWRRGDYE